MIEFKYKCCACGRKVKEHRLNAPAPKQECSTCYMRRTGPTLASTHRSLRSLAKKAIEAARRAEQRGDLKAKKKYASKARSLLYALERETL